MFLSDLSGDVSTYAICALPKLLLERRVATSRERPAAVHPMKLARTFGERRLELLLNIPTMATGYGRESAFIDKRYALLVCDLDFTILKTTRWQGLPQVLQKARRAIQVEPFPSHSRINVLQWV